MTENASEEAMAKVSAIDARNIKLAVTDLDGVLRGKYVSRDKFQSALEKGFGSILEVFGYV